MFKTSNSGILTAGPVSYPIRPIELGGRLFQMLVLHCNYDCRHNPLAQESLARVLALKVDGYLTGYHYGVLPVDSTDYFATHLTLCEVHPKTFELFPVMSMKSLTLSQCKTYDATFPPFALITQVKQQPNPYEMSLRSILDKAAAANEEVGYNGSYTVHPSLREDKALSRKMRELTTAFIYWNYTSRNIRHVITAAIARFKIDSYVNSLGFNPICADGQELPPFPVAGFVRGEPARMMYLQKFTDEAKAVADSHQEFWNKRIVVDKDVPVELPGVASATAEAQSRNAA